MIAIILIQAIVCGLLAGYIAERKGYSPGSWIVLGFLFSIFGLIAAAGLPSNAEPHPRALFKKCPRCAEMILAEALVCRFCGHNFSQEETQLSFITVMEDESKEVEARLQAIEVIGSIGDKDAIPHLQKIIGERGKLSHSGPRNRGDRAIIEAACTARDLIEKRTKSKG